MYLLQLLLAACVIWMIVPAFRTIVINNAILSARVILTKFIIQIITIV